MTVAEAEMVQNVSEASVDEPLSESEMLGATLLFEQQLGWQGDLELPALADRIPLVDARVGLFERPPELPSSTSIKRRTTLVTVSSATRSIHQHRPERDRLVAARLSLAQSLTVGAAGLDVELQ